jgi:hypothetical protein
MIVFRSSGFDSMGWLLVAESDMNLFLLWSEKDQSCLPADSMSLLLSRRGTPSDTFH